MSVVIVNWNARDELLACLESLRTFPPACAWEAIVVDNASSDGSVEAVQEKAPWARVIVNSVNRGLPAANNQGMVAAIGNRLLISNPDVLFRDGSIDELCAALDRHASAAIAVPQVVQASGQRQTSAGALPTLSEAVLGSVGRRGGETSGFWWHRWPHDEERRVGHGAEACYLVRREAAAEVGAQDELYRLDWEGIDWSARLAEAGWEIWFVPSSVITHLGGVSIAQAPYRWIVSSHRGMYRYFSRRFPLSLRPALAVGVALRVVLKLAWRAVDSRVYARAHRRARFEQRPAK